MKLVRLSALHTVRLHSPENTPGTHFCNGWVDSRATGRPEGLCQWKMSKTPSRIKPVAFRLVAHCINPLQHCLFSTFLT